MGALSRNVSFWRNHVMFQSSRQGTGGQMAALMQLELESISDGIFRMAWVQQRAAEAQLDAQYRLARVQEEATEELSRLNATAGVQTQILAHVSSQLDQHQSLLQSINDATLEHNSVIKSERLLKEVLFQLDQMLNNMVLPEDPVAKLFLSRTALEELEKYGLGSQHLGDIADKQLFTEFVKKARQTVRDAPEDVTMELLAFETGYKGYEDALKAKHEAYDAGVPPKQWVPERFPAFTPGTPPVLEAKSIRRPSITEVEIPVPRPDPKAFAPLPEKCWDDSPYQWYPGKNDDSARPFFIGWDSVPTQANTDKRFPLNGTIGLSVFMFLIGWLFIGGLCAFAIQVVLGTLLFLIFGDVGASVGALLSLVGGAVIGGYFCGRWCLGKVNEVRNARRFEDALREWARQAQAWYDSEEPAWDKIRAKVETENEQVRRDVFPAQLAAFDEAEAARREEYERSCEIHRVAERGRYDDWRQLVKQYLADESERRGEWMRGLDAKIARLVEQARYLNEFINEHPDCQLLYRKVDGDRAAARYRKKALRQIEAVDEAVSKWKELSQQDMPEITGPPLGPP